MGLHRPGPSWELKPWLWEEKVERAGLPWLIYCWAGQLIRSSAQHMCQKTQQNLEPQHASSPPFSLPPSQLL